MEDGLGLFRTDMWRTAIIRAPAQDLVRKGDLEGCAPVWLPDTGSWTFLADPFGIWLGGLFYVFVEAYDYRDRHGRIDVYVLDSGLELIEQGCVLCEPWHLSYPVVFESAGEIWMLPEAYRSGSLCLYRATKFPWSWERVEGFAFPEAAIDASPIYFEGKWWIFYTPPGNAAQKKSVLNLAWSDNLLGPWHQHDANPVWVDRGGARPGGTIMVRDGALILPTQDCTQTYGGAIRFLSIDELTSRDFGAHQGGMLRPSPGMSPYLDGLHTFSAAGSVTLIDAKRISRSPGKLALDVCRRLGRPKRSILSAVAERA